MIAAAKRRSGAWLIRAWDKGCGLSGAPFWLLFKFLPVLSTEESSEPSRERWSFVVSSVGMKHEGTLWRRQGRRLVVGDRTAHQGRGDVSYLITVNEAQSVFGLHGDAIKEIQLWNLQDVLDCAELRIG
jgi:hypothetical protein